MGIELDFKSFISTPEIESEIIEEFFSRFFTGKIPSYEEFMKSKTPPESYHQFRQGYTPTQEDLAKQKANIEKSHELNRHAYDDYVKQLKQKGSIANNKFFKNIAGGAALIGATAGVGGVGAGIASNVAALRDGTAELSKYKPEEILYKGKINPYEFIKSTTFNADKFAKDHANLPDSISDKVGHGTFPLEFMKPKTMMVVNDEALKRVRPGAGAYASGDSVIMPKKAFTELPSEGNPYGQLTKWGKEALQHELRHTTQKNDVPSERQQVSSSETSEKNYDQYMFDPQEMDVRLAAFKNVNDKEGLFKLLASDRKGSDDTDLERKFVDNLPDDETERMAVILSGQAGKYATKRLQKEMDDKYAATGSVTYTDMSGPFDYMSRSLLLKLRNEDHNIDSLITHLMGLEHRNPKKYQIYMQELKDSYNKVVQSNQSQKDVV